MISKFKIYFIFGVLVLLFAGSAYRLFHITFLRKNPHLRSHVKNTERGMIVDEQDKLLAFSKPAWRIYLNTKKAIPDLTRLKIKKILSISNDVVDKMIHKPGVYLLKRYVTKEIFLKLLELHHPSVLTEKFFQREYPAGVIAPDTLGFVHHGGGGGSGIEFYYDRFLKQKDREHQVTLKLTLNAVLQSFCEDRLKEAVMKNNADSGMILIQDIRTGAMKTAAHFPSWDPQEYENYPELRYRHPSVTSLLEPGSVIKIFFLSWLLEFNPGFNTSEKIYHCRGSYLLDNGEKIRCSHPHGMVSFEDIIRYSCNTGVVYLQKNLTRSDINRFLNDVFFYSRSGVDIPGEPAWYAPPLSEWGVRTKAMIPLGHGFSVTPVQLISTLSALANGGIWQTPYFVREGVMTEPSGSVKKIVFSNRATRRIFTEATSRKAVDLLLYGTANEATGEKSRMTGFRPAGKTGTVQQVNLKKGGYYTNRYNAYFAAVFPPKNPEVSVLIVLKNPQIHHYGGSAAAPLYAQVIPVAVRELDIYFSDTVESYKNKLFKIKSDETIHLSRFKVPDLSGLSFRDAIYYTERWRTFLKTNGIHCGLRTRGNGYLKKQSPPPGKKVQDSFEIILYFNEGRRP